MSLLHCIFWIEKTNDDPRMRVSTKGSHEEMRIILVNHFRFIFLLKFLFPLRLILAAPFPPRLPHLPICADESMAGTRLFIAPKFILKAVRHFFQ